MKITSKQYQEARKALGYSNYALRRLLGVSLRQAQRYESGDVSIPERTGNLLYMLWRFGVPQELGGAVKGQSGQGKRRKASGRGP